MAGDNVGIVTGGISHGNQPGRSLVCIDIDHPDALAHAAEHLPPTDMKEGRPGKLDSHWWYLVDNATVAPAEVSTAPQAVEAAQRDGHHPGPKSHKFGGVEYKAAGTLAEVPPSLHPSGERRQWSGGTMGTPARANAAELLAATKVLAKAHGGWTDPADRRPKPTKPARVAHDNAPPTATPPARGALTPPPVDVPVPDRVRMAVKYLQAIPDADLSRTGQGGHDALFRVARVLVNDFALPEPDARGLLDTYNARLVALNDAWSAAELAKKVADAVAAGPDERFGCKLIDIPPRDWNDGERLAEKYLSAHRLVNSGGVPHLYAEGVYHRLTDGEFTNEVSRHCQTAADAEYHRRSAKWDVDKADLDRLADDLRSKTGTADPATRKLVEADLATLGKAAAKHDRDKARVAVAPAVVEATVKNAKRAILARCELPPGTELDQWLDTRDGDPKWAAVFANGLLCLDTLTLHPHTPRYFTTCIHPVAYDKDATCPKWDGFITDAVPDTATRAVLQECFGACFDPRLSFQHFVMLVGEGGSGKSVAMHVLQLAVGLANRQTVSLKELIEDKHAKADLEGKRLNVCQDEKYFHSECESVIKVMTGDGTMRGRRLYEAAREFPNTARLFIIANEAVTFSDRSNGVYRRLVYINWRGPVAEAAKNKDMNEPGSGFWDAELPGVVNWCMAGYRRFVADNNGRLTKSAAVAEAVEAHRLESDHARNFLTTGCEFTGDPADSIPQPALFAKWEQYVDDNRLYKWGQKPKTCTPPGFAAAVKRTFPGIGKPEPGRVDGKPCKLWKGLRVKPDGGGVTE